MRIRLSPSLLPRVHIQELSGSDSEETALEGDLLGKTTGDI